MLLLLMRKCINSGLPKKENKQFHIYLQNQTCIWKYLKDNYNEINHNFL